MRQYPTQQQRKSVLEQLTSEDATRLTCRYEPLPTFMQGDQGLEHAIKELSELLAYQIDEKWGIQTRPR